MQTPQQPEPEVLFESTDAGRVLGIGAKRVRFLARVGELRPVAVTPRGVRLFAPSDVLRLRAARARRGAA
jgi:DNA-binding transcriptional MerR regulator